MACESCGDKPKKCDKDFTKAVIEIDNPEQITLMRKVTIPASMGDDTTVPPAVGKYHNVLLYYEANHKSYLYSSDGIPTLLANGLTDYEEAVNLPEINGHTLLGNQTGPELGLQNEISHLEQYARYFDTVADMKASIDLSDGDYAKTGGFHSLNDGGGALYKITDTGTANEMDVIAIGDLYATLIKPSIINPEIFGAYGDGIHDDSSAIQACLSSNYPISMTKTYLINSTLNVGGHNEYVLKAEASTIIYTGNGSALLIKNINGGQIDLGRIRAENGSCIEFSSTLGTADRTIYTDLTFKHLSAGDKCISINTSGTGYVSENSIRGGELLHGNYGVYIYANPSANEYGVNAIHFANMGFEGPDVNYYIEATSTRYVRGLTFTNDRFVENTTSKIFEIHGNVQRCTMNSWSHIDESRLDFTNATLRRFKLVCPVYKPNTTTIYADGIYYDGTDKRYLFNEYSANLLTKNTGVTGSIRMIRYENLCILLCSDITVTSNGIDLVNAGDNPYIPAYTAQGCLTSGNGNSARVFVRATDGSIHFATSSASAGDTFYGTIIYPYKGQNT